MSIAFLTPSNRLLICSIAAKDLRLIRGLSHVHIPARSQLPRISPGRGSSSTAPAHEAFGVSAQWDSTSSDIPWFLQDQALIEVTRPVAERASLSEVASTVPNLTPYTDINLPLPLRILHAHIVTGPTAGLLHRASFLDEDDCSTTASTSAQPVRFIPARSLAGSTSWCDWVVIVTVRENNGGQANARVAEEAAEVLRRMGPPRDEDMSQQQEVRLDDLLGPGARLSGARDPYGPASKAERLQLISRRNQSNASQEECDDGSLPSTTPWALHRQALRHKFADSKFGTAAWRPNKILSRETQSGLRLLHSTDPQKWSVTTLSAQFKVSPEAIRRILRANPERWGGDSKEAGRGSKLSSDSESWRREDAEIERLRGLVERDQARDEDQEAVIGDDDPSKVVAAPVSSPVDVRSLGKPHHPVRFEGLPASSSPASRRRSARALGSSMAEEGKDCSGGEWVLVDAGWCVVHVMTPKARLRYDLEGFWNEMGAQKAEDFVAI